MHLPPKTLAQVLVVALGACATNPATHIAPNNNPLLVKDESGTGTYVSNDVVAESTYTDSNGNSSTYQRRENREHEYNWNYWSYYQGREELDEEDYYRLAGDQANADKIDAARSTGELQEKIGVPIMVAGLLAAVAFSSGLVSKDTSVRQWGTYGSSALASTGGMIWYFGHKAVTAKHHLSKAEAIADADVVQTCWEKDCRTERGGRVHPPAAARDRESREDRPAPAKPSAKTVVGRWRGASSFTISARGKSEHRSNPSSQFEIAMIDASSVAWIPDPAKPECKFEARLDGTRAELVPGKTCTETTGSVESTSKILSGSLRLGADELGPAGLTVHVELEVTLRDLGGAHHRKPPVKSTVTVDAIAHQD